MNIILLNDTTEFPLQKIGETAGICWGAPVDDVTKNIKRAKDCIKSDHGRTLEWVNIELIIESVSARCMREIGRHCVGTSYLQSSTRYIDESNFVFYVPPKCNDSAEYSDTMVTIHQSYQNMLNSGIPGEDAANILPLGMYSKMIWKINLRSMVNFMQKRLCMRALNEIRTFAVMIKDILSARNEEWDWIVKSLFVPGCERFKYRNESLCFCQETRGCGRYPKVEDIQVNS